MTVATTGASIRYNGNGSTDTFAYDFRIFADTDLVVKVDSTTQTITTDYTVTGAGDANGGNVVFESGSIPASGTNNVVIIRAVPETQASSFSEGDKFPTATANDALDKLTMLVQQHSDELSRCLKVPNDFTSSTFDAELPDPGTTAAQGKPVRITTAGTGLESFSVGSADTLNVITTRGDLIRGGTGGTAERVAIGTTGYLLTSDGTDAVWATGATAMDVILTTRGDIIYRGTGTSARLALGSDDTILISDGTDLAYGVPVWTDNENYIINPDMDVWQVNTSFTTVSTTANNADMYSCSESTNETELVWRVDRDSSKPTVAQANRHFNYSLKIAVTTPETTAEADEYFVFRHIIEGYRIRSLVGQPMTLSFWVRNSITGTYSVSFASGAGDRKYIATYTIDSADTWEQKTINLTMDDISAGTWNMTQGTGMYVQWSLYAGSNYHGTAGAWATVTPVDDLGTAADVSTWITTNGATFYITGIELVRGNQKGVSRRRGFQEELALCQRYFAKTYDYATATATSTRTGDCTVNSNGTTSAAVNYTWEYPVEMRATPTITGYNPNSGTANEWRDYNDASDKTLATRDIGSRACTVYANATVTDTNIFECHIIADARLS